MENKFEEINEKGMVSLLKQGLEKFKRESDTFYVLPSEFYIGLEDITKEEEEISNYFLSMIGSNKNDQELIVINIRPFELFNIFITGQRLIKSKQSPL